MSNAMDSADLRSYSRGFLTEVIELYKSLPCLWKTNYKDYSNRSAKSSAWDTMVNKFREVDREISRQGVIKKMNSLRTSWRKEAKKIRERQRSTINVDKEVVCAPYYTKLWYFEILSFIQGNDLTGNPTSTMTEDPESSYSSDHSLPEHEIDGSCVGLSEQFDIKVEDPLLVEDEQEDRGCVEAGSAKRQKTDQSTSTDFASALQTDLSLKQHFQEEDCHDHFGRYVASMLRTIPSADALTLQKDITVMLVDRLCALSRSKPQRKEE